MTVEALKEALKLAAGETENNENEPTRGKANVYENPEGHQTNTTGGNVGHSVAVVNAARDGREDMVERLFDSPKTTGPTEQALLHSLFNKETVDNAVTPHAAMLRRGRTKTASDETLTDRVLRVVGHR
jgi:hypothetical protein